MLIGAPWLIMSVGRYIQTPIIGPFFDKAISGSSAEYASVEDAAGALMRIACDEKAHGRAFGIVPRSWEGAASGYVDLDQ